MFCKIISMYKSGSLCFLKNTNKWNIVFVIKRKMLATTSFSITAPSLIYYDFNNQKKVVEYPISTWTILDSLKQIKLC
jgi:hypothetical protein